MHPAVGLASLAIKDFSTLLSQLEIQCLDNTNSHWDFPLHKVKPE